jgi:hypothetical protein
MSLVNSWAKVTMETRRKVDPWASENSISIGIILREHLYGFFQKELLHDGATLKMRSVQEGGV